MAYRNGCICVLLCIVMLLFGASFSEAKNKKKETILPYKDSNLSVEQRVADLLGRMTLEEKIAQTWCAYNLPKKIVDENGSIKENEALEILGLGIGHIARLTTKRATFMEPREGAELTNKVQKFLLEKTRLGIPAIIHDEGLHGHVSKGGTAFPQAIALASTWDPELIHEIFTAVAREMRSRGATQALAPVVGLARDPRWGRTEETYGEDPYLVSRMAVACVTGFQGSGPFIDNEHVISTTKHFAVYSKPERGLNFSPGNYSERLIREMFLKTFHAAITEGGAMSVMPSYNEIDGVPTHANTWLLQKVLREEWGFKGFIVSDYSAIDHLYKNHFVAHDKYEAGKKALEAGVDIELPYANCYGTLLEQIQDGRIAEATLDKAISRILRAKFLLGLFDDPYVDPEFAEKITNCEEHKKLALKAAQKAVILLKNEGNLLPLDMNKLKSLAVLGPNAADVHLGGYSSEPRDSISILDGIKNAVGKKIDIRYSVGCRIVDGVSSHSQNEIKFTDAAVNTRLIKEAVEVVRTCDVAIVVVGGNEQTCRETWNAQHLGDRCTLNLIGQQEDLVRAIVGTGMPTIVILINGRPLAIPWVAEHVPAILEGWYLGQETGTAVSDVLFGACNPGGKLPITFPRSVGHLPVYYNHKPVIDVDYIESTKKPLFPFGYGLSYTTFRYDNLKVTPPADWSCREGCGECGCDQHRYQGG